MSRFINTDIFMKKNESSSENKQENTETEPVTDNTPVADTQVPNNVDINAMMQPLASTSTTETNEPKVELTQSTPVEQSSAPVQKERGDGSIPVIEFNNITQIFNKGEENEYKLFENFNLTIPDFPGVGQLVSIMGASGCGKSRLVRALCGLDTVQSGSIKVYGKDVKDYDNIPMVFQSYSNYHFYTIKYNVMLPMLIRGIDKKTAEAKAIEYLKLVGLEKWANDYPHNLSGGGNQRVSIARNLACASNIFVLDEATGALDIKMKREVQNIILKIFYETQRDPTILNITHSIEEAAYLSNRVIILKPNPCTVHKVIDINYTGEKTTPRGEWIFDTAEYAQYIKEITQAMDEVCK